MDGIKKHNENREKILQDSAKLISHTSKENTNSYNEIKGSSEKANLISSTIDKSKINVSSEKGNDKVNSNTSNNLNTGNTNKNYNTSNLNSNSNSNGNNLELNKNELVYGESKIKLQDAKKLYDTTKEYLPSKEQTIEGVKEGIKVAEKIEKSGVVDKEKKNPLVNKLFGTK
jgi:hypothetical protein